MTAPPTSSFSVSFLRKATELLFLQRRRSKLGVAVRSVRAGGYTWSYLDNSSSSRVTVVFIHGFSSEKDTWLNIMGYLAQPARLLAPDLPGHGATTPSSPFHNYSVGAQVRNLLTFLDKTVGPDIPVHLVGHSMGGLIAGVFAATFPHLVSSVTLLCPAGISMPTRSPVLAMLEDTGVNLMQATTVDAMQTLLWYAEAKPGHPISSRRNTTSSSFHHNHLATPSSHKLRTRSNRFLSRFYAKHQADRKQVVDKILSDMLPERTTLEDRLADIEAPTLVLWGSDDQILDVSCVDNIHRHEWINTVVVAGCGHTLPQRRPEVCAAYIVQMIQRSKRWLTDMESTAVLTSSSKIDYYFE
ncbi:hypothetical protein DYB28_004918 [Aphanomyces astaci]|uniref:AB hydrolase-1 domain-containing protein n=1 Tax=Aphanomyces astaci TaxID=112090 RepID=A0A9X8E2Y3_APHAT|nr:hypothetical protein DYB28_004918 [Aphanomyces astaci]